jgi:hypothetical protein
LSSPLASSHNGRGWINLDTGAFYRRGDQQRETKKRQPPIRLPGRLLAHIRRWKAKGICHQHMVEWNGDPVLRITKAFRRAVKDAGLGSDVTLPGGSRRSHVPSIAPRRTVGRKAVYLFAVLEAADPVGRERDVVRPLALEVGAGDLALAARHRRCTAISFFAGCLNSFAAISMASRLSTASISPTHWRFAASL